MSVALINPFEVPAHVPDDRFLAGWERAADLLRSRPGFIGSASTARSRPMRGFATSTSPSGSRRSTSRPRSTTPPSPSSQRTHRRILRAVRGGKDDLTAQKDAPGAPVSTPLRWDELTEELTPRSFGMREALERVKEQGDLFEPALAGGQALGRALKRLA